MNYYNSKTAWILSIILLGASFGLLQASPSVTWRQLLFTDLEPAHPLLGDCETFCRIVPPRATPVKGLPLFTEKLKAVYETFENPPTAHYFFCTVYYTPRQAGFKAERGFDVSKKWLGGKPYGNDFYRATRMEGFSRLENPPIKSRPYVSYTGKYHSRILGNRGNTLVDRESVAVHRRNPLFGKASRVWILDPQLYNQFGALRFQVGDTGGGLYRSQIDLYWGEDDPMGPGPAMWRPASCDVAVSWIVPCLIWK